jgi:hypothetical protein
MFTADQLHCRFILNKKNYRQSPNDCKEMEKVGIKKEYFTREGWYGMSYRIIVLKDRSFAVEQGGGMGYFIVKTWPDAVNMRRLFMDRHRRLERMLR